MVRPTRALARQVGGYGINVNTLSPGLTMSDWVSDKYTPKYLEVIVNQQSLKRNVMPEDMVGTAIFLASSDSDMVTGQVIMVNGGRGMH